MKIAHTSRLLLATLTAALLIVALPLIATAQDATAPSSSLLVKLIAGLTADQQATVIARNGGVETSSIPALRLHVVTVATSDLAAVLASYQADPQVQHVEVNRTRLSETIVPADPLYPSQWALPKIGWDQVFGAITPAVSAKVALLDTGVDASHPELAGKVLPGTSILDGSDGRTDSAGHGTWLAGIIAAKTDTIPMEGISAVAYAGVQILPVTVLNANGEGQDSDVIAGVIWAADHGADVILMAFSAPEFSQNLQDAIDYAWAKGAVVVAAVGNNAVSTPTFPAGDRGVMGVAATDQNDAQAYFSNQGQAVFIAAPGVDIQTIDLNGNYIVISGTSASAAHVAGLAAFMKAADSTLTNGVIVGRIARNADPAGMSDQTGNGRINMPRALADTNTDPVQPAGADPVGQGGPFVGPYRAAAKTLAVTLNGTGGGTVAVVDTNQSASNFSCTRPSSGTCSASPSPGNTDDISITVTPNASSFFAGWTVGGVGGCTGTAGGTSACTFNMGNNAQALTATFTTRVNTTTTAVNQTTTFSTSSQSVTLSVTVAATPTVNEGTVTFTVKDGVTTIGSATTSGTVSGGNASVSYTLPANTAAKTYTIQAVYNPATTNPQFNTSSDSTHTLTINKANHTINFGALGSKTYGDVDFSVSATASSGLTVSFSSQTTGTCTVSGTTVHIVAAGSCTIRASQSGDSNYNAAPNVDRSFTISKKVASVTATDASKTYGATDPASFATTNSGFVAADLGAGKITFSASRAAGENQGTYTITPTPSDSGTGLLSNYTVTFNTGTFTINKKAASVTAADNSKTYGSSDPALTGTLSGFLPADNITATYARAAGENVGTYVIAPTLVDPNGKLGNYTVTSTNGTFTIGKKAASVTATNNSKTYGDADPALTTTNSGFQAGDLGAGKITFSASRAAGENQGTYTITPAASDNGTGLLGNYTVTFNTGTFTINKKAASVTAADNSKTYGASDRVLTGTLSGFLPADNITATYARAAGENVGTYVITPTLVDPNGKLGNYTVTSTNGTFTINKKAASVAAADNSKVYGDADPTLTGTLTGFLPADNISATYARVAGEDGGSYVITPTLVDPNGKLGNYTVTSTNGTFTISKRAASVTAADNGKIYGSPGPALTGTLSGFVPADGISATYARAAGESVGSYAITPTLVDPNGKLGNYSVTSTNGTFTISKKSASVTAADNGKTYGGADPVLTGTLSGFLVADGISATYARVAGESVGSYVITPTLVDPNGKLGNYTVTSTNGTFTISVAALSVTADDKSRTYGDANPPLTGNIVGIKNGDNITASYSTTATPASPVGTYAIVPTLNDPDGKLGNYSVTVTDGTLTIGQAGSTTAVAAGAVAGTFTATVSPVAPGTSTPTGTVTFTVDGNPVGLPVALDGLGQATSAVFGTSESTGSHTITAEYSGDTNYSASSGSLTDNAAGVADDAYVVLQTTTLTVGAPGVLGNDSDADAGQTLTAVVTTGPAKGTLTLNGDGSFSYTPAAGPTGLGAFTFKYRVFDGVLYSPEATVTITVLAGNETPVALNDAYSVTTGNPLVVTAASGLLANDQGQTLSVLSQSGGPSHGTLALNADGSFTYTPAGGVTGVDSFLYQATSNGLDQSNLAMVTITVLAAGASPVAVDDFYLTTMGDVSAAAPGVLGNDSGSPTAATLMTGPLYGTLIFGGDGSFAYTAGPYFAGVDSFTYRAGASNVAVVTIRRPSITIDAPTVTYNNDGTVTVTVTFDGLGPATGSVTLSVDGGLPQPAQLLDVNGKAQFTATSPTAGDHDLGVVYTNGDYQGSSRATGTLHVNKATPTINWSDPAAITYGTALDGTQLNATATALLKAGNTPVAGTFTYTPPAATMLNAGAGQVLHVDFVPNDTTNFTSASKDVHINVNKATPTVTVSGGPFTYDGASHAATVTVTGVNGETVSGSTTLNYAGIPPTSYGPSTSAPTNAGTYRARAVFTSSDGNYADAQGAGTITIDKATPTVSVAGGTFTYDSNPHPATGFAYGVAGPSDVLSPAVTFSYEGTGGTTYGPTAAAPTNAGTYQVTASFAGNANYNSSSATATITINKASSTTTVTVSDAVYDATPHGGSAVVTGVGGLNQTLSVTYTGINGTVYAASTTAPTNAGQYSASATYAGDANHESSSDSKNFTVKQATPTITVTGGTFTYDGASHAATYTLTGVNGVAVSGSTTLNYAGIPPTSYGPSTTPPTNAGTYQVRGVFTSGDPNYTNAQSTAQITINKAGTTTTVTVSDAVYDATPHGGSALVTGAGGLNQSLTVSYSGTGTTVYGPSTTAPTNAGTYAASATYAETANYLGSADTKSFIIAKAATTTTVTVADATYDATPHGGMASVVGSGGLNQSLTVSYTGTGTTVYGPSTTAPTNAGTYTASATYAETANYLGSSDTRTFTINLAAPALNVTGGTFTYDATSHAATYTLTGVGGVTVSGSTTLNYAGIPPTSYGPSMTPPTDAGTYRVRAVFTSADGNYTGAQSTVTITITRASSTTMVTVSDATYDTNAHGGSAVVTGVGGLNQSLTVSYTGTGLTVYGPSPTAPTDAGTYSASATFAGDANHDGSSDSKPFTINKAASVTVVSVAGGTSFTYDALAHPATVSVTGVGLSLSPAPVYSCGHAPIDFADSGCTASYSYPGDANHIGSSDSKTYAITQAGSVTTVTVASAVYDGGQHGGSAAVTGIGGLNAALTITYTGINGTVYSSTTPPTDAGDYTAAASFAGDANHTGSSEAKTFSISRTTSAVSVTWNSYTYDASAHAASGFAYGVGGSGDVLSPAVTFSYAGTGLTSYGPTATAPADAGTYEVTATFAGNGNYTGSFNTADITISKADPTVTVTGNTCVYAPATPCAGSGSAKGVNGEDLPFNLAYKDSHGNLLTSPPVNAGMYQVAARFAGNVDYNRKQSAPATITIKKAAASLVLSDLVQVYDGSAKHATVTTTPSGLSGASITYNGSTAEPTNDGRYPVIATLTNDNYSADPVNGTFEILRASAGSDQTVSEDAFVTLHGSGYGVTHLWQQVAGTSVTLSDPTSLTPTFTAPDLAGGFGSTVLTFQLTSSDGVVSTTSSPVNVRVLNVNNPPVPEPGTDKAVAEGSAVTLNGSGSYDPDGDQIRSYQWQQTAGPIVALTGADTPTVAFNAPTIPGGSNGSTLTLKFRLTVSDGALSKTSNEVTVSVDQVNHAPVADAGAAQTVNIGSVVTLNGSGSTDPDGDSLTYTWTQVTAPGAPVVALTTNPNSSMASFTAPATAGQLTFNLRVSDGLLYSDAQVKIMVVDANPRCGQAYASVATLWPPDHRMVPISIMGVTNPDNEAVTITILSVTQDEPTNGLGDGDTPVDAVIQGSSVLLRAERSGTGDGRVYKVNFRASDQLGVPCTGSVTVGVPHDQGKGKIPIDSGQKYDSTR